MINEDRYKQHQAASLRDIAKALHFIEIALEDISHYLGADKLREEKPKESGGINNEITR